jgi:hypothetical protein
MPRNTIATDNFTRADAGTLGANWTDLHPGFPAEISSNTAVGSDTSNDSPEAWGWHGHVDERPGSLFDDTRL